MHWESRSNHDEVRGRRCLRYDDPSRPSVRLPVAAVAGTRSAEGLPARQPVAGMRLGQRPIRATTCRSRRRHWVRRCCRHRGRRHCSAGSCRLPSALLPPARTPTGQSRGSRSVSRRCRNPRSRCCHRQRGRPRRARRRTGVRFVDAASPTPFTRDPACRPTAPDECRRSAAAPRQPARGTLLGPTLLRRTVLAPAGDQAAQSGRVLSPFGECCHVLGRTGAERR